MTEIKLYLLGSVYFKVGEETISFHRRKSIALLAYLALNREQQSRDNIAALLWPDYDGARAALRTSISELNNSPISEFLVVDRDNIMLKNDCWVDVRRFEDDVASDDLETLENAVDLYRDDFLTGFSLRDSAEFDEWQSVTTERLHHQLLRTLEILVERYIDINNIDSAIRNARRWLTFDPLNENVHYQLMTLFQQSGQRIAALRQYEEYSRLLETELGIEPHVQMTEFYERLKDSDGSLYDLQRDVITATPGVLPGLPTLAVGRDADIDALKERIGINSTARQPTTIVQGWPGVGKSTLVALLAHDHQVNEAFPDGILWTSLGEDPNLLAKLEEWAQALGANDVSQAKSLDEAVTIVRSLLHERDILLIVDDVWQIDHGMAFKVGGAKSATIFTTRFNDVAYALADRPNNIYKLGILPEERGLDLLRALAPGVVQDHHDEAIELVRDLEGLPLALQVAGRMLHAEARMGWGVDELLLELREGRALLEAQAPADRIDIDNGMTPTVAVLLQSSVARLSPELQERFALLGVFAPKPATFDLDAMAAVWEDDSPRKTARTLVDRGLLEPIGGGRFQMHALLAMHARSMFI